MPVVYHQLHPANNALPGYAVAKELARQTVEQFGQVRNLGAGVANASCCAAFATAPGAGLGLLPATALLGYPVAFPGPPRPGGINPPTLGGPLPYAISYGNSQMAGGGLVLGPVPGHAERTALAAVVAAPPGMPPPPPALHNIGGNNAVLFVELTPCGACQAWLNGAGGGAVVNPFNGIVNGGGAVTLHVWWRWEYPTVAPAALPAGMGGVAILGGSQAMNTFHSGLGFALSGQVAHINGPNW
jgi:hypothetical protein